jgi:uncharacterized membrane protein (DUF106 family)
MTIVPPISTTIIAAAVLGITLLQQFLSRRLMNPDERKELDVEVKAYRSELQEAKRLKDKQALKKLEKRETRIRQLEGKMASASAKQMAITMGVYLIVFYSVINQVGGNGAYISSSFLENFISFPDQVVSGRFTIPAIWWYFICATFYQSVLGRLLGTGRK